MIHKPGNIVRIEPQRPDARAMNLHAKVYVLETRQSPLADVLDMIVSDPDGPEQPAPAD